MASAPPFLLEDQTDEDFFDKLVDDEFTIDGSHSTATDMARDLSNLGLGDIGTSLEDSGDVGFASEVEDRQEKRTLESSKKDGLDAEGSMPSNSSDDKVVQSEGSAESAVEIGLQGLSPTKSGGLKGTSVKEVQWSAFSVNSQQFEKGGFDSFSDFLMENADGSADKLEAYADLSTSFTGNTVENINTYVGSSEQQDTQFHGSGATDTNDAQYWESLYPGWKYDPSTGQWYQVDGYDASTSTTGQMDSYNTVNVAHEGIEDKAPTVADGSISERSDVSYLQQSAQSVLETITEDSTLSNVSNWNQVSQVSTEYPPNMVFDPQYPGWYYDTNTQQWYTLETYTQTTQMASSTVQHEVSQDVHFSAGLLDQNQSLFDGVGQSSQYSAQSQGNQDFEGDWNSSTRNYMQERMWQPEPAANSKQIGGFPGNQQLGSFYSSTGHAGRLTDEQTSFKTFEPVVNHNYGRNNGVVHSQSFVPAESTYQFNQPKVEQSLQSHLSNSYYGNQNSIDYSQQQFQGANVSHSPFSYIPHEGRSSAGRPAHALVTFGFGGKLIIMKDVNSFGTKLDYGSQTTAAGAVSVLNLAEVVMNNTDVSSTTSGDAYDYFRALCQQSFPGPLVGGNAATKDINKWIDERITSCESTGMDFQKGELLKLLLSLLKISCQHYGKLRSPFGSDPSLEETDGPEMAVTNLFASAKRNSFRLREYGSFIHCMQNLPSEGQIRATAVEVQSLLVSGRRKEALQCAQEGQLWGPALVLAAQLGEKFYVDTVKKMAHRQFICGSPLRTLCLLIAGQPADVFSAGTSSVSLSGAANIYQQPAEANGMFDDWEENLAIITANRTKDDELVIIHLGDCLWKERGEVAAAHTCYLVAEANFESYSDSARLCLVGADHWKCPRTYASPEAIQRTELYEYSKVLGNSQFILLPFQPYKLIYAYMLADMGKVPDSLRYCQSSLKLLKNSGRNLEMEKWKLLFSSLEERLKIYQQGGYSTNLAPGKLVGKFINSLDKSLLRMMGAPQLPPSPMPQGSVNDKEIYSGAPKVANSQSTMAMSSLIPSASVDAMSEWTSDSGRKSIHNRSISEPDFGRSPKQSSSKDAGSDGPQSKSSVSEGSRFGRIGSTFLQKTMGWVSRSHRQAKLGEQNKFYYDEKLKRWVEEGAEPPAEEAALPPPPTAASFQNGAPDYNINNALKSSESLVANGGPGVKSLAPTEHSSGIPPIPPSQNQFSARSRMGVRSRYVDTFNKGGGALTNSFQSPSAPSLKPPAGAKFFIPTAPPTSDEPKTETIAENIQEAAIHEERSTAVLNEALFSSPSLSSSSSSSSMRRFPSMDHITPGSRDSGPALQSGNGPMLRTRPASWSGMSGSSMGTFNPKMAETNPIGDGQSVRSFVMPNNTSHIRSNSSSSVQLNGGSLGDDLQEVDL